MAGKCSVVRFPHQVSPQRARHAVVSAPVGFIPGDSGHPAGGTALPRRSARDSEGYGYALRQQRCAFRQSAESPGARLLSPVVTRSSRTTSTPGCRWMVTGRRARLLHPLGPDRRGHASGAGCCERLVRHRAVVHLGTGSERAHGGTRSHRVRNVGGRRQRPSRLAGRAGAGGSGCVSGAAAPAAFVVTAAELTAPPPQGQALSYRVTLEPRNAPQLSPETP